MTLRRRENVVFSLFLLPFASHPQFSVRASKPSVIVSTYLSLHCPSSVRRESYQKRSLFSKKETWFVGRSRGSRRSVFLSTDGDCCDDSDSFLDSEEASRFSWNRKKRPSQSSPCLQQPFNPTLQLWPCTRDSLYWWYPNECHQKSFHPCHFKTYSFCRHFLSPTSTRHCRTSTHLPLEVRAANRVGCGCCRSFPT